MLNKLKCFKEKPVLADILDLVLICVVTIIIGKLLTTYIILTGYVPSGSMENMIMTEDRILANRMAYWSSDPQRGDIAVFYAPDEKAHGEIKYFVKRVIGLPGETITIRDNQLFVNGIRLEEPYIREELHTYGDGDYKVPEGHYFMLGDNRENSKDSRYWNSKYVPKEDICGKVFLKYSLNLKKLHLKIVHSYNEYQMETT